MTRESQGVAKQICNATCVKTAERSVLPAVLPSVALQLQHAILLHLKVVGKEGYQPTETIQCRECANYPTAWARVRHMPQVTCLLGTPQQEAVDVNHLKQTHADQSPVKKQPLYTSTVTAQQCHGLKKTKKTTWFVKNLYNKLPSTHHAATGTRTPFCCEDTSPCLPQLPTNHRPVWPSRSSRLPRNLVGKGSQYSVSLRIKPKQSLQPERAD